LSSQVLHGSGATVAIHGKIDFLKATAVQEESDGLYVFGVERNFLDKFEKREIVIEARTHCEDVVRISVEDQSSGTLRWELRF